MTSVPTCHLRTNLIIYKSKEFFGFDDTYDGQTDNKRIINVLTITRERHIKLQQRRFDAIGYEQ